MANKVDNTQYNTQYNTHRESQYDTHHDAQYNIQYDIQNKLQDIFRDVFDDETLIITKETSSENIRDWDSLAQINIIAACEFEFGVKFSLDDIVNIDNAGDIIELIERKSM